jgi:hypothetical protein
MGDQVVCKGLSYARYQLGQC